MKTTLWTLMALGGLTLTACGHDHSTASMPPATPPGNSGPGSSAPGSSAPTDFVGFVDQQLGTQPAFGIEPAVATSLTTDLGTASSFSGTSFGSGDALPAGTNQASVACTQAGKTACNPAVSVDLNSTLN